ncbi:sigma factor-like helix-turn-helix DNA-binding protein [Kribbella sp. NPDC050241]|uniref:sigma factor-like helix-turn-helix DNA-binding protein n=1 Tax=Kribbella sp. NPDC050241 TaxID=3364115 RepID=UPI003793AECA
MNVSRSCFRRATVFHGLISRTGPPADVVPGLSPDHVASLDALRRLPWEQREVIALHHLVDLPVCEIAAQLGIPEGTVKAEDGTGRRWVLGDTASSKSVLAWTDDGTTWHRQDLDPDHTATALAVSPDRRTIAAVVSTDPAPTTATPGPASLPARRDQTPADPVVSPVSPVTGAGVESPVGDEVPRAWRRLAVLREQSGEFVEPGVDPSMRRMALNPSGAGLVALVPAHEDLPLVPLQRNHGLARRPDDVLVQITVDVVALEIVRRTFDGDEPGAGTVNPVQLDGPGSAELQAITMGAYRVSAVAGCPRLGRCDGLAVRYSYGCMWAPLRVLSTAFFGP